MAERPSIPALRGFPPMSGLPKLLQQHSRQVQPPEQRILPSALRQSGNRPSSSGRSGSSKKRSRKKAASSSRGSRSSADHGPPPSSAIVDGQAIVALVNAMGFTELDSVYLFEKDFSESCKDSISGGKEGTLSEECKAEEETEQRWRVMMADEQHSCVYEQCLLDLLKIIQAGSLKLDLSQSEMLYSLFASALSKVRKSVRHSSSKSSGSSSSSSGSSSSGSSSHNHSHINNDGSAAFQMRILKQGIRSKLVEMKRELMRVMDGMSEHRNEHTAADHNGDDVEMAIEMDESMKKKEEEEVKHEEHHAYSMESPSSSLNRILTEYNDKCLRICIELLNLKCETSENINSSTTTTTTTTTVISSLAQRMIFLKIRGDRLKIREGELIIRLCETEKHINRAESTINTLRKELAALRSAIKATSSVAVAAVAASASAASGSGSGSPPSSTSSPSSPPSSSLSAEEKSGLHLIDPITNENYRRMAKKLREKTECMERMKEEMMVYTGQMFEQSAQELPPIKPNGDMSEVRSSVPGFTLQSTAGRHLIAKCRTLSKENELIGKELQMTRSKRFEEENALLKQHNTQLSVALETAQQYIDMMHREFEMISGKLRNGESVSDEQTRSHLRGKLVLLRDEDDDNENEDDSGADDDQSLSDTNDDAEMADASKQSEDEDDEDVPVSIDESLTTTVSKTTAIVSPHSIQVSSTMNNGMDAAVVDPPTFIDSLSTPTASSTSSSNSSSSSTAATSARLSAVSISGPPTRNALGSSSSSSIINPKLNHLEEGEIG